MIFPSSTFKIYLATDPVDFRKGMDGLAAHVMRCFDLDPFCGAFFVFRSKGSDKTKVLMWDGTGLVLIYKRNEGRGFRLAENAGRHGDTDQSAVRGSV